MSSTFDIFSFRSVPSTYSWDKGTPTIDFEDFVTDLSACSAISNNDSGVEYVGYAPFVFVSLSSSPGQTSNTFLTLRRTVDFGDFYNSDSNFVTYPTLSNELFCHTYIMPGLYTIQFERTEYIEIDPDTFFGYGACLQKHCIDWSWKTLSNCTSQFSITWSNTLTGNQYEKKWKFEPCDTEWAFGNGLYVENTGEEQRTPLSWQWYNFLCDSADNIRNTSTKWISSGFQQPNQLTWASSSGPCINLRQTGRTVWKWNNLTCNLTAGRFTTALTWDQTRIIEPKSTTWDYTIENCIDTASPLLSSGTRTVSKEALIRVIEIPPTAYLEVTDQPSDRISPLTVRLSPKSTVCGSFPIERIVWDLGDGSPLITQRRWSNALVEPFVYSGALSEDYQDPRNYDIVHTYTKTSESGFCFYPSITAFASSTNTSDCAAAMVGPLKLPATTGSNFKLLQNELTEYGKVLIGQVDDNVAVWRTDK